MALEQACIWKPGGTRQHCKVLTRPLIIGRVSTLQCCLNHHACTRCMSDDIVKGLTPGDDLAAHRVLYPISQRLAPRRLSRTTCVQSHSSISDRAAFLQITLCSTLQHSVTYSLVATAAAHIRSRCERALGLSDHSRSTLAPASSTLPDSSLPSCSLPLLLAAAGSLLPALLLSA